MNCELLARLTEEVPRAEADETVRAVILTGALGVCSAGLDVQALMRDVFGATEVALAFQRLQQVMVTGEKPVISTKCRWSFTRGIYKSLNGSSAHRSKPVYCRAVRRLRIKKS